MHDDFYTLIPNKTSTRGRIGEHKLIELEAEKAPPKKQKTSDRISPRFTIVPTPPPTLSDVTKKRTVRYKTEYSLKSWQNKAWDLIGGDIDWDRPCAFKNIPGASRKLSHMKRTAVCIKVKPLFTKKRGNSKPVIESLAQANNPYGMYAVADTYDEFYQLMYAIYVLLYESTERLYEKAKRMNCWNLYAFSKAFIVYDDKSYDILSGNPQQIQGLFGFGYDKNGRIVL